MSFLGSIRNSVTSAVNTASKVVASGANSAAETLTAMKRTVLDTTKRAASATASAVYTAAKTVKKYGVVPYELAHTAASGLAKVAAATGKAAKVIGHTVQHAAHHAGHVLHHGVERAGGAIQKAAIAAAKKLTPLAAHGKVAAFGAKFLKATVLAPVLSGIKTAYKTGEAIKASFDPNASPETVKKLWVKAAVSAGETALNAVTRLSPYGLAFAVADVGTELVTGKDIGSHVAKAVVG